MIETIAVIISIASTILGGAGFIAGLLIRSAWKLDRRLDSLEDMIEGVKTNNDLERRSIESRLEMHEYRINANTELINHRSKRLESGLSTLAQALEKYSHGEFVNRSPGWPTDDPPSQLKGRTAPQQ